MDQARKHIFISYATEQAALCDWLARRLAAYGYHVWYDRLKLLGGEHWPRDIDFAIDERTFRMLALLSRESIKKTSPTGEWLKALAVGKRLKIDDFLITLNTDGLTPEEIPWNLQAINYIDFSSGWASGLASLLRKLESIQTPRTLHNGRELAIDSMAPHSAVTLVPERLSSNCFPIAQLPRYVRIYSANLGDTFRDSLRRMNGQWACWGFSASEIAAFEDPPDSVTDSFPMQLQRQVEWRRVDKINGLAVCDLLTILIYRCLDKLMASQGLAYHLDRRRRKRWYFPYGLLASNFISLRLPSGRAARFKAVGQRTFGSKESRQIYQYHLVPVFSVVANSGEPQSLYLKVEVYFKDRHGAAITGQRAIVSRRKHLCKDWFNREWYVRTLGIAQVFADDSMHIRVGCPVEQQLVVSAVPDSPKAPMGIDDDAVDNPDDLYTYWQSRDEIDDDVGSDTERL